MRTSAPMVVYCHTPARWLYAPERYASTFSQRSHVAGTAATGIARLLGPPLRRWDAAAAARATTYVANSRAVRDAVRRAYGIEAELVPPPPALDPAGASQPIVGVEPGFVLTVSRLLPYKNVDLVLAAARERPTTHFVIVGDGPLRHEVEREAPHNVRLLHSVSDDELRWLYDHAAALLAPSFEDFGLTPLEAASMGTPTAALRAGGYLDTVDDGVTGSFFDALQVTDVLRALDDLACNPRSSSDLRAHAERFSRARFINSMQVIAAAAAR
jgi:glycosyltransferase involved in cell wall biosynthesis